MDKCESFKSNLAGTKVLCYPVAQYISEKSSFDAINLHVKEHILISGVPLYKSTLCSYVC